MNQILDFLLIQSYFKASFRWTHRVQIAHREEVRRQQMNIIALIDTRPELPGETIGTVISTHSRVPTKFPLEALLYPRMQRDPLADEPAT